VNKNDGRDDANKVLSRSLDILKTHFQDDVLAVQDPWATDEQAQKLLQLLPDPTLNDSLRRKWEAAPGRSSTSKWADIDAVAKTGASKRLDPKALLEAKQDIVLEYTYPRLDIEVSKKLNHLLKSPFVVHPGTGRVCVPIDTKALEDFDPLGVPTVQSLLAEIDTWKGGEEGDDDDDKSKVNIADWEKTSLKPYVEQFRSFVSGIIKDEGTAKAKREREDDSMDF
jgi:DNA primase small subunit